MIIMKWQEIKITIRNSFLFQCYQEWLIRKHERQRFLVETRKHFENEKNLKGSFSDYKHDCRIYRVDYSEYMYQYEFWALTERQKKCFVSRAEMQSVYRKMVNPEIRRTLYNKALFLQKYSPYIHRKWVVVRESSFEQFLKMIGSFDCIAKPIEGSLGNGIFKINKGQPENVRELYNDCIKKKHFVRGMCCGM